ncbi:hypothetical protein [Sulfitobacter sp.]
MTALAMKPEELRLGWSAQTAPSQINTPISLAFQTESPLKMVV